MRTLSEYLKDEEISQRAFARVIGVDPSIVSRLVSRSMRPSLDLAVAIERQTDGVILAVSWVDPVKLTTTQSTTQEDAA